jgi:hypothetical protein
MGNASRHQAEQRRLREERLAAAQMAADRPLRGHGWALQIKLGIPVAVAVLGIGVVVSGPVYFWYGIAFGSIGTAALAVYCLLASRKWTKWERLEGFIGVLLLGGILLVLVSITAPILVSWRIAPGNYPSGTKIAGIDWADNLTHLQIYLDNKTDRDYSDLDISIRTDLVIHAVEANNPFAKCTSEPESIIQAAEIYGTDKNGKPVTIPVPMTAGISSIYRVRCEKLPSKSELELNIVLSPFAFGKANPLGTVRVKPSWAKMNVSWEGYGRFRSDAFDKCFVGC